MNEIIRLENASIGYNKVSVIDGIDLSISRSESWGIIGPNGGGKTTLLKTLIGLQKVIKGVYSTQDNISFGYVPQKESFDRIYPISVAEVVSMGRYLHTPFGKRIKKRDWQIIGESIDKLGISHLKEKNFGSLSGGEIQKTLIARAIAGEPDVLVLDEPTASVDSNGEVAIMSLIKKIKKENKLTVIMVSHHSELAKNLIEKFFFVNKDKNLCEIYDSDSDKEINDNLK